MRCDICGELATYHVKNGSLMTHYCQGHFPWPHISARALNETRAKFRALVEFISRESRLPTNVEFSGLPGNWDDKSIAEFGRLSTRDIVDFLNGVLVALESPGRFCHGTDAFNSESPHWRG